LAQDSADLISKREGATSDVTSRMIKCLAFWPTV